MIKISSKKEEYELFNKLSNDWWNEDGKFKILHQIRPLRISYILRQLNRKKLNGLKILDVGCGGGLITESLCRLGADVTGVDFVQNNIRIAKEHSKLNNLNIKYVCKDVETLNNNDKFDVIIMFEVLEHIDDWKNFLNKIKKNLKKNGTIILSTINRNLVSKISAIIIAENILKWVPKGTHDYNKLIQPKEIEFELRKNGFDIKNFRGIFYNPILNRWDFTENTAINYFCTASKN